MFISGVKYIVTLGKVVVMGFAVGRQQFVSGDNVTLYSLERKVTIIELKLQNYLRFVRES